MIDSACRRLVGSALCVLILAPAAAAQQLEPRQGFGIGFRGETVFADDDEVVRTMTPVAYVATPIGDDILLEPSITLAMRHVQKTETLTSFRVGLGVLFMNPQGSTGRSYWGPRIAVGRLGVNPLAQGTTSDAEMDVSGALVGGVEYLVASDLAMGGEAGLEYRQFGGVSNWTSIFQVLAELRLRWYLW